MNPDKIFLKAAALLKAALYILCIVVGVFGILFILRNAVNALFLYNYANGNYSTVAEYTATALPFGERYVLYYNLGDAEYQKGNYEKAITYYTQALSEDLPEHTGSSAQSGADPSQQASQPDSDAQQRAPLHDRECRIRLNLAFTMCHTVDFDHLDFNDQEAVMQAVTVLIQARYILTECGCASEPVGSNDGHFRSADKLKHDIDKMLQLLQSQSESDSDDQNSGGQGGDQDRDGGQDEEQSEQENSDQEESSASDQSQSQHSEEKRDAERARQEDLKEELRQQKEDLKTGSESPSSYEYEYLDGGDAQGYGDGTLW